MADLVKLFQQKDVVCRSNVDYLWLEHTSKRFGDVFTHKLIGAFLFAHSSSHDISEKLRLSLCDSLQNLMHVLPESLYSVDLDKLEFKDSHIVPKNSSWAGLPVLDYAYHMSSLKDLEERILISDIKDKELFLFSIALKYYCKEKDKEANLNMVKAKIDEPFEEYFKENLVVLLNFSIKRAYPELEKNSLFASYANTTTDVEIRLNCQHYEIILSDVLKNESFYTVRGALCYSLSKIAYSLKYGVNPNQENPLLNKIACQDLLIRGFPKELHAFVEYNEKKGNSFVLSCEELKKIVESSERLLVENLYKAG